MEEIIRTYDLLMNVAPLTNTMSFVTFGSFYCMLLEEWCKAQGEDIVELLPQIVAIVKQVNEEEGQY